MPTTNRANPTPTATSSETSEAPATPTPAFSDETPAAQRQRLAQIIAILKATYPDARCSLDFTTPWELLVATILAAQCTDERVNSVTKRLFAQYPTVYEIANADPDALEQAVKQITFYRNKAKNIRTTAQMLVNQYQGEVPRTLAEVAALPGAARKTANVVLGNAYGIVEGIAVDTHVGRISRRLGLTQSEDPVVIEQVLMRLVPKDDWVLFSHLLIFHGRAICQSRKPLCAECSLAQLCPTGRSTLGLGQAVEG